jgi:uncharacterized protein
MSHASNVGTIGARLQSLDVVRGVAVMGILLLNIVSFAMPEAAYMNPRAYGGWHGADLGVYLVNFVLFDGKMRGLFSFLFGASMLLVIERAEASGRNPARAHYRRMIWLLEFGLAHLWLIWQGDILAHYALIGMVAFAMRGMAVPRLVVVGILFALVSTLIFSSLPLMIHYLAQPAANPAMAAERATQLRELNNGFGLPPASEIARQLALMRVDYASILADRVGRNLFTPLTTIGLFGPETLAYMLFGMAGLKSGMLRGEWTPRRYRKWLIVCWAIALPAYIAIAAYLVHAQFTLFAVALGMALATPMRPLMIIGWACLILLLARGGGALASRIAAAGRMAFTNYLMTSLICTTLFYGYGLGWFGHLSRWQLYPVVFGIWGLMLLWSQPWLARFRFGPFEWLWRSLSRGSVQPLRGSASI